MHSHESKVLQRTLKRVKQFERNKIILVVINFVLLVFVLIGLIQWVVSLPGETSTSTETTDAASDRRNSSSRTGCLPPWRGIEYGKVRRTIILKPEERTTSQPRSECPDFSEIGAFLNNLRTYVNENESEVLSSLTYLGTLYSHISDNPFFRAEWKSSPRPATLWKRFRLSSLGRPLHRFFPERYRYRERVLLTGEFTDDTFADVVEKIDAVLVAKVAADRVLHTTVPPQIPWVDWAMSICRNKRLTLDKVVRFGCQDPVLRNVSFFNMVREETFKRQFPNLNSLCNNSADPCDPCVWRHRGPLYNMYGERIFVTDADKVADLLIEDRVTVTYPLPNTITVNAGGGATVLTHKIDSGSGVERSADVYPRERRVDCKKTPPDDWFFLSLAVDAVNDFCYEYVGTIKIDGFLRRVAEVVRNTLCPAMRMFNGYVSKGPTDELESRVREVEVRLSRRLSKLNEFANPETLLELVFKCIDMVTNVPKYMHDSGTPPWTRLHD